MKISTYINSLYHSKLAFYEIIKSKVDTLVLQSKYQQWHYEGRIKGLESFALKLETGRFNATNIFNDFFACTIVVKNNLEISKAIEFVKEFAKIVDKKPRVEDYTHKQTCEFSFDDLRLYVKLINKETGSISQDVLDCIFEIQIKTFLQHAWAIATHDLIYKSPQIHWGKERVAYQVKAALEHAEVTISNIEKIYTSEELQKDNKETKRINNIIFFIDKNWDCEDLPRDKRRLAQNIFTVIESIDIDIHMLQIIINKENDEGRGTKTLNLSPFLIVIQSICNQHPQKIIDYHKNKKGKVFLTPDLDLSKVNALLTNPIITF